MIYVSIDIEFKKTYFFITNKLAIMSDFKSRLVEEKQQLDERLEKLKSFQTSESFKNISPIQQTLLNVQANAMATYSQVLLERISWIEMPTGSQQA